MEDVNRMDPNAPRILESLKFPFRLILVTGSARSGTTVTHAALCTPNNVNQYVPEASSFTAVAGLYYKLAGTYDVHHYGIFGDQQNFGLYFAGLMRYALITIWENLGKPEVLCLKDPYLMKYVPLILQLVPEAKFVISIRNPLDTIASLKTVLLKRGSPDLKKELIGCMQHYKDSYQSAFHKGVDQNLYSKVYRLKYEDFVKKTEFKKLSEFLDINIDESKIWQDSSVKKDGNEYSTDLLWNKIDSSSIDNFKEVLTQEEINQALEITEPVLKEIGYEDYLKYKTN